MVFCEKFYLAIGASILFCSLTECSMCTETTVKFIPTRKQTKLSDG